MGPAGRLRRPHFAPGRRQPQPPAVPFQRMLALRRAPELFCSLSARGAGRGYPICTRRIWAWGLSGAPGGNQPGRGAQLRLGMVSGAPVPENLYGAGVGGGAERRERAFPQLVLQTFKGTWGGGGKLPFCTLAQAPADGGGEGGWDGVLSHHQAGSIRAQPRSDQTSQPSAVSQASDQ